MRGWNPRIAMSVLALLVPCALSAQDEIFERGNQLYQEGDFLGAVEAYETVLSAGFEGAALHYNLGNAYFKVGDLGRSILEWERALVRAPGDPDATANLELARSLTVDAVNPLPRFWLLSVWSGWTRWLPRSVLILVVGAAWLLTGASLVTRIWSRSPDIKWATGWVALASAAVVIVFGINLLVRELGIGQPERAVVLEAAVQVRAAPAEDDDLTLFEIHEGTRVRVEQRTGTWVEVILDDGKVGWVPDDVMELI